MNRSKLDELSSELLLKAAEKAKDRGKGRQASNLARGAAQGDPQIGIPRTGKYSKVKQREDSSRDLFVDRVIGVLLEMRLDEGKVKARNKASNRLLMQIRGRSTEGPGGAVAAGRKKSRENPPTQGTAGGGSAEGTPIQRKVKLDARQGLQSKKIP